MNARLNRVPKREVATVPVFHTEPRHVCTLYPDCECEQACVAGGERRRLKRVLYGLIAATVLIGGGVILASLKRFNWIFCLAMAASLGVDIGAVLLVRSFL